MKEVDFQALVKRLQDTIRALTHQGLHLHTDSMARSEDIDEIIKHADRLRTRVVRAIDAGDDWDKDEPILGYEAGLLEPADPNFEALSDRLGS